MAKESCTAGEIEIRYIKFENHPDNMFTKPVSSTDSKILEDMFFNSEDKINKRRRRGVVRRVTGIKSE